MVDLHDYDIELMEKEILWKYNDNRHDYSDCECLLSLRKDMINKRVLAHQEEILPDIIAFNDALRDALKEMYDRAHSIWDNIKDNAWGDKVEVSAKCLLGYDYPELHPYKVKIEKYFGVQSLIAVGIHYMTMVSRCRH